MKSYSRLGTSMVNLPVKFLNELRVKPETGMGYQIVNIILSDGRRYDRVIVIEGMVSEVKGMDRIPFTTEDIVDVILTHQK